MNSTATGSKTAVRRPRLRPRRDPGSQNIVTLLFPHNYLAEPPGFPGLTLVWVGEIAKFGIVRFFINTAGAMTVTPIAYEVCRATARRRMEVCQEALSLSLQLRSSGSGGKANRCRRQS